MSIGQSREVLEADLPLSTPSGIRTFLASVCGNTHGLLPVGEAQLSPALSFYGDSTP